MKRKVYLLVSSIIQIISSIYLIINANEVVKETLESIKEVYKMFPEDYQDRVTNLFQNGGVIFIIGTACTSIILNILIFILVMNNKMINKRGVLIGLSSVSVLTSSTLTSSILSIVNIIVLVTIKNEEVSEVLKEKKEIPKIKYKKASGKEIIFSIILFLAYFSQFIWEGLIPDNKILAFLIAISFYVIMFILVICLFWDKISNDFKLFKNNFKEYMEYIIPKYGLMIITFIIVSLICTFITKNGTSVNQEAVEALPKLMLIILSVIWAPVVEETIFRGVIRRFIKNDIVFIILSAFVFGFLHAASETSIINIIVMTIPYATLGGFLSYIYAKSNNLVNNMFVHSVWNLIAATISILTMFVM